MIRNYLRVAVRALWRNKLYSLVNIAGLAFSMASGLLIFMWVMDEHQVDHFHAHRDRLYRVMENQQYTDGRVYTFNSTPGPMAPFIKEKYPEIELATRFTWESNNLFEHNDKRFVEKGRYVDQDFLDMFTFPFLAGDPHTALKDKNSVVISRAMAERYFGKEPALGKLLVLNTKTTFTVSGVLADIPHQSSIQFDYLLPFQFFWDENKSWLEHWDNNNIRTFLLLKEGANVQAFGEKFRHELREHVKETTTELFVQPVADMYLYGDFENGKQAGGRIEYVRIFFIVALVVLLIACINFTNLSTAQAGQRAREAGMRKVIGAVPAQIFRQFMGESMLIVLLSAVFALLIAAIALPAFNELASKHLALNLLDSRLILIVAAMLLITAFFAGSYPALFMSRFRPVEILKGQLKSGRSASAFRRVLVVAQFTLSIFLIISTIVVYQQMAFMENKDIGFDRNNLFYLWMDGDMPGKYETVRERLLRADGIAQVTASGQLPIDIGNSTTSVHWEGKDPETKILFSVLNVDYDFIQSMKMEMAEGRPFDRALVSDSLNYIVNERAAEKMGYRDGTAGKDLTLWEVKGKIVGVVKDFNFGSLYRPIDPLILHIRPRDQSCLIIRAREHETEAAIRSVEALAHEYAPQYPFKYAFLSQDWENYYKAEGQRGKIFNAMAGMSILISCLGLFGLSAHAAGRRVK
ncbi:MAG: ABC transporter permease, partial [Cyclobacteriaceae bacterium]|nr:ABC transporter permease [Cyclobacteriaceae bacterium]